MKHPPPPYCQVAMIGNRMVANRNETYIAPSETNTVSQTPDDGYNKALPTYNEANNITSNTSTSENQSATNINGYLNENKATTNDNTSMQRQQFH